MLKEEFCKKYPGISWDFHFDEDQSYAGYPTITLDFIVDMTIEFSVTAENIESCLDIADKIMLKISEIDYSKTENYLLRASDAHNHYFEMMKEWEEKQKQKKGEV